MAAKTQKQRKTEEITKPEKCSQGLIVAGYIFSILGGFIGILIGWSIHDSKKILPGGKRVYTYEEGDRKNGMIIFFIGVIVFSTVMILKLFGLY